MNENNDVQAATKTPELPREVILDLRAAREARGFSLEDVFAATRVSMINLTALEGWDFDRLPPPVYTRNFIRKYAQAIGIDEKPILNHYERHLEEIKPPRDQTEGAKPHRKTGWRYLFLFVSLILAIAAGILAYTLYPQDPSGRHLPQAQSVESTPPAEAEPASPLKPSTLPEARPRSGPPPDAPTTTAETASIPDLRVPTPPPSSDNVTVKPLHLIIEAREHTWVKITQDRHSSTEALLKPGEKIERRASEFFQLDIGNAAGIDLTFQGNPMGSLGKRGQVIHLRLPEEEPQRKTP